MSNHIVALTKKYLYAKYKLVGEALECLEIYRRVRMVTHEDQSLALISPHSHCHFHHHYHIHATSIIPTIN